MKSLISFGPRVSLADWALVYQYGLVWAYGVIILPYTSFKHDEKFSCLLSGFFFINAFGFRPKTHVWFEAGKHLYTSVTVDSTSKMHFGTVQKIN